MLEACNEAGRELENEAFDRNFTVKSYEVFEDYDICCIDELDCCTDDWSRQILKHTKDLTKTYIFIGKEDYLVKFTDEMSHEDLFDQSDYNILYIHPDSGHGAHVFAMTEKGKVVAEVVLEETTNHDWEDIAVNTTNFSFLGPF